MIVYVCVAHPETGGSKLTGSTQDKSLSRGNTTNPQGSCVPIGPSDVQDQHCLAMRAARPLPNLLSNASKRSRMSGIPLSNDHYFATRLSPTLASTVSSSVPKPTKCWKVDEARFFDQPSQRVCHKAHPGPGYM